MSTNRYTNPEPLKNALPPLKPFSKAESYEIFHQNQKETINFFTTPFTSPLPPEAQYSQEEDVEQESSKTKFRPHPLSHLICHITIPNKAHPEWHSKRILWGGGSAEKLIKDYESRKLNFDTPIPTFQLGYKEFKFVGWWKITSLQIVEPHSEELQLMLRSKEESGAYPEDGRTEKPWTKSLTIRWVKINLVQVNDEPFQSISSFKNGEGGEYVLKVGRLNEEVKVLRQYENGDWEVENGSR